MQLGDLAHIFAGRAVKRAEDGHPVALVGLRDIGRRIAPRSDLEEVKIVDEAESSRLTLLANDVVVTSRGANVRAAVAQEDHEGALVGPNLIVVRLKGEDLPPDLVAAYLRHPLVSAQLLREFAGATTPGFTIDSLKRLPVQLTNAVCSQMLAELVRRVDDYSEYHLKAVQLHQAAAEEAVFEHLGPHGPRQR